MSNTTLTYTAAATCGPTAGAQALTRLQALLIDGNGGLPEQLTLLRTYGLLAVSDTIAASGQGLSRIIVTKMTPTIGDATATAALDSSGSGQVKAITVTGEGGLYGGRPVVTFTGGSPSSPAQAFATCKVRDCNVLLGGTGYVAPVLTFVGGLAPGGTPATATATVGAGIITGITMVNHGGPYQEPPFVLVTDSAGVGAEIVSGLSVSGITPTYGGVGYHSAPTVVITSLFKQMIPDTVSSADQVKTLQGWLDAAINKWMNIPFTSQVVAS